MARILAQALRHAVSLAILAELSLPRPRDRPLPPSSTRPIPWTGIRGARKRLARAQRENKPILAVDRLLLRLSLVSRDGTRIVRRSRDGGADEPLVRRVSRSIARNVLDLDRIYQLAHQMLARRAGGWPLTMFLHRTINGLFRRNVLSQANPATACQRSVISCRRVDRYYRESRRRSAHAELGAGRSLRHARPTCARRGPATHDQAAAAGSHPPRGRVRQPLRWFRSRAQVPACNRHRTTTASLACHGR